MFGLSPYPSRVESWIEIWEMSAEEFSKKHMDGNECFLPDEPKWKSYFCVCREEEATLSFYHTEKESWAEPSPSHINICRLEGQMVPQSFAQSSTGRKSIVQSSTSLFNCQASTDLSEPSRSPKKKPATYLKDDNCANQLYVKRKTKCNPTRKLRHRWPWSRADRMDDPNLCKSATFLDINSIVEAENNIYEQEKEIADQKYTSAFTSQPGLSGLVAVEEERRMHKRGDGKGKVSKRSFSLSGLFTRTSTHKKQTQAEVIDFESIDCLYDEVSLDLADSCNSLLDPGTDEQKVKAVPLYSSRRQQRASGSALVTPCVGAENYYLQKKCLPRFTDFEASIDPIYGTEDGYLMAFKPATRQSEHPAVDRKDMSSSATKAHRFRHRFLFSKSRQRISSTTSSSFEHDGNNRHRQDLKLTGANVVIRELDASLAINRRHCLLVNDQSTVRVLAASSDADCKSWLKCLRRTAKPNLESERHRENSLFLSILEAKGLQNKRRYYCDVCLDRTLYARTTSKSASENSIFWAEEFDLNNLPEVSILTISIYRESEYLGKAGRRGLIVRSNKNSSKKSHNRLVGFVTLPVSNICTRNPSQNWLTMQPPGAAGMVDTFNHHQHLSPTDPSSNSLSSLLNNNPSSSVTVSGGVGSPAKSPGVQIRASVRYKSVDVLPLSDYWPLYMLVREKGLDLADWFEPLLPVKMKEEVASSLVNLRERSGTVVPFLTSLVVNEISTLENESMTFRSNTMATKAVESYIKLVGKDYLHSMLHRYIQRVLASPDTWEVDPDKLSSSSTASSASLSVGSLLSPDGQGTALPATVIIQDYCIRRTMPGSDQSNVTLSRLAVLPNGRLAQTGSLVFSQTQLLQHLDLVWETIRNSLQDFPRPLLQVFSAFRAALQPTRGAEFCDKLISACIFLRLICPAILTPSLFGLASTFAGESNCQRNLTLVAKSLQSLANLATFGDKEPFMRFMNVYVEAQIPAMQNFLRDISCLDVASVGNRGSEMTASAYSSSSSSDLLHSSFVANHIDCGYELASLQTVCVELFASFGSLCGEEGFARPMHLSSSSSVAFPTVEQCLKVLPTSLSRLPSIIGNLENRRLGLTPAAVDGYSDALRYEGRVGQPSGDPCRKVPVTYSSMVAENLHSLPRFSLAQDDQDEVATSGDLQSLSPVLARPTPLRPGTLLPKDSKGLRHRIKKENVALYTPSDQYDPTMKTAGSSSCTVTLNRTPTNTLSRRTSQFETLDELIRTSSFAATTNNNNSSSSSRKGEGGTVEETRLEGFSHRKGPSVPLPLGPAVTTAAALDVDYDEPYSDGQSFQQDAFNSSSIRMPSESVRNSYDPFYLPAKETSDVPSHSPPISFPSPPSAFSLYRRRSRTDLHGQPEEQEGADMNPLLLSRTSSSGFSSSCTNFFRIPVETYPSCTGIGSSSNRAQPSILRASPDLSSIHPHGSVKATTRVVRGGLNDVGDSTSTFYAPFNSKSSASPNLFDAGSIDRQGNCFTQVKQYPHRSSASSSGRSSFTSKQESDQSTSEQQQQHGRSMFVHHYPYRQAVNASIADASVRTSTYSSADASLLKPYSRFAIMSTSIDCSGPTHYLTEEEQSSAAAKLLEKPTFRTLESEAGRRGRTNEPSSSSSPSRQFRTTTNASLSSGKSIVTTSRKHWFDNDLQPLAENEKVLSSTLEELGDAVAWLERERHDLLHQERMCKTPLRMSNQIVKTPLRSYPSAGKRISTNTSVPSLHWACKTPEDITPLPPSAPSDLNKSTKSLACRPNRSQSKLATTTTIPFLLSHSASGSVSPHRSRHSSESIGGGDPEFSFRSTTTPSARVPWTSNPHQDLWSTSTVKSVELTPRRLPKTETIEVVY